MLEQSSVVVGSKEDLLQLLEPWGTDTGERKHQN
jgi:hypothetical protein